MNVIDSRIRLLRESWRDSLRDLQAYSMALGKTCNRAEDSMLEFSNALERIRQMQLTKAQK